MLVEYYQNCHKHQLLSIPVGANELLYRRGAKTIVSRQALTGAN